MKKPNLNIKLPLSTVIRDYLDNATIVLARLENNKSKFHRSDVRFRPRLAFAILAGGRTTSPEMESMVEALFEVEGYSARTVATSFKDFIQTMELAYLVQKDWETENDAFVTLRSLGSLTGDQALEALEALEVSWTLTLKQWW